MNSSNTLSFSQCESSSVNVKSLKILFVNFIEESRQNIDNKIQTLLSIINTMKEENEQKISKSNLLNI